MMLFRSRIDPIEEDAKCTDIRTGECANHHIILHGTVETGTSIASDVF